MTLTLVFLSLIFMVVIRPCSLVLSGEDAEGRWREKTNLASLFSQSEHTLGPSFHIS